jgi:hypothetical protein
MKMRSFLGGFLDGFTMAGWWKPRLPIPGADTLSPLVQILRLLPKLTHSELRIVEAEAGEKLLDRMRGIEDEPSADTK